MTAAALERGYAVDPDAVPLTDPDDIVRAIADDVAVVIAGPIATEDRLTKAASVSGGWECGFGSGRTWGRLTVEQRGLTVYRQIDGSRTFVPWDVLRNIRRTADPAALAALEAALVFAASGPRWRPHTLPPELRWEGRDPAMSDADLIAAQRAASDVYRREVAEPVEQHRAAATARLRAALAAVLTTARPTPTQGAFDLEV